MKDTKKRNLGITLESLGNSIARWTEKSERCITAVPGLIFVRHDEPTQPMSAVYEPSICLVAQGAKRVQLGNDAMYTTPAII
jgi:uncharacterized RmlC-like cupin family protein